VASGSAGVLEILVERPVAPDQEKVHSTTQPRGRTTKPFMSSLRLTISIRSSGSLCHRSVHLPGVAGAVNPDQLEPREAPADLVEHEPAPSQS